MRPAVWVGYVTGAPAPDPARRDHVPALRHRRLALEQPALDHPLDIAHRRQRASSSSSCGCTSCAGRPTAWSAARRSRRSTTTPPATRGKALRAAAIFGVIVYALLPLGAVGTFGDAEHHARQLPGQLLRHARSTTSSARGTGIAIILLCAGHRARDEHGHGGRVAGALRHLPGRHDHPLVREAEPPPRPGERDDAGRAPEHHPAASRTPPTRSGRSRSWCSRTSATCSATCSRRPGSCCCARIGPTGRGRSRSTRSGSRSAAVLFVFDLILLIVGAANVGLAYGASTRSTLVPVARDPGDRARAVRVPRRRPGEEVAAAAAAGGDDARGGGAIGAPTSTV